MSQNRAIIVVVNPGAGRSEYHSKLQYVYRKLNENDISYLTFFTEKTQAQGKLRQTLLSNSEYRELWVLGGDGTLNYTINEINNLPVICSIVSGGTGNDSVKSLHGVTDFKQQVEIALDGHVKKYDLGICNNLYFVNGIGIGFDGRVVEKMVTKDKRKKSHLAYLFTVVKTLAGYREKTIRYFIDDVRYEKKLFLLTISNGTTFGGGFIINPNAKTDDGLLDVCTIDRINIAKRFKHLPKLKDGSHTRLKVANFHNARSIKVEANKEVVAHMDGEFIGKPPFDIQIAERKLLLRSPANG